MNYTRKIDDDLELLLCQPHHAEEMYAVIDANREHLGRWLPWPPKLRSVDDQRRWVRQNAQNFAEIGRASLGIRHGGRIVGGIGNNNSLSWDGCIEIDYWLTEDAVGQGLATRCCRAMIDDAFAGGEIHRVNIRAEPENTDSCAVPERLGFLYEGTLRHVCRFNDRWINHRLYAMLKEDWEQQDDHE